VYVRHPDLHPRHQHNSNHWQLLAGGATTTLLPLERSTMMHPQTSACRKGWVPQGSIALKASATQHNHLAVALLLQPAQGMPPPCLLQGPLPHAWICTHSA
jgi:hypothetical protein